MKKVSNRSVLYFAVSMIVVSVFLLTHRGGEFLKLDSINNSASGFYSLTEKNVLSDREVGNDHFNSGLKQSNSDAKTYFDNIINRTTQKNNFEKSDVRVLNSANELVNLSGLHDNRLGGMQNLSKMPVRVAGNSPQKSDASSQVSTLTTAAEQINASSGMQKVTTQPAEPGSSSSPALGSLALGDGTLILLVLASVYVLKKWL